MDLADGRTGVGKSTWQHQAERAGGGASEKGKEKEKVRVKKFLVFNLYCTVQYSKGTYCTYCTEKMLWLG